MLIQSITSVAANSVVDNLLTGSQFEYLPWDASLEFGVNGPAAGNDQLRVDIYSGQDILAESMIPNSQARIPVRPDDFNLVDVAQGGERIKVRVRNLSAGALNVFWAVRIDPV